MAVTDIAFDDYDPRKPEYIQVTDQANMAHVEMIRKQMNAIQSALRSRKETFQENSQHLDILQHYEHVLQDLAGELRGFADDDMEISEWHRFETILSTPSWDAVFEGMSLEGMCALEKHLRSQHTCCSCEQSSRCSCASTSSQCDIIDSESTLADSEDMLSVYSDGDDFGMRSPSMDLKVDSVDMPIAVSWKVNARHFCTSKFQIESPIFKIGDQTSCRITLKPTPSSYINGPASFLKSSGYGSIDFELVEKGRLVTVSGVGISIGRDAMEQSLQWPGRITPNFEHNSVCQLGEHWHFLSSTNLDSRTVLFSIEVFVKMSVVGL
jgi:hypothetical protein